MKNYRIVLLKNVKVTYLTTQHNLYCHFIINQLFVKESRHLTPLRSKSATGQNLEPCESHLLPHNLFPHISFIAIILHFQVFALHYPTKLLYEFTVYLIQGTCLAHHNFFDVAPFTYK